MLGREFKITGKIDNRGTGYYHVILSAGYDEIGKRNRMSFSTGLEVKNNMRNATVLMNDAVYQMTEIHKQTGKKKLKELYTLYQNNSYIGVESFQDEEKDITFSSIVDEWLQYVFTRVSENTYMKYEHSAKNIKLYFKKAKLSQIDSRMIAKYYGDRLKSEKNPEGLSATTLADHKTVFNGTMRYAIEIAKLIEYNPVSAVSAPKKQKKLPSFYNKDELNEVFQKIMGHPIEGAVYLAGNLGLRRGEVVGLKWSAIDFEKGYFYIRHTVTRVGNKEVEQDRTKTTSSLRSLPIPKFLESYLKQLKKDQESYAKLFGNTYIKNDYVCKWPDGRRLRADFVTNSWRDFVKANGMRPITFHDLRHSSASMLIQLGFSLKEVQEWLGHADIKSTVIYTHLVLDDMRKVADRLDGNMILPEVKREIWA